MEAYHAITAPVKPAESESESEAQSFADALLSALSDAGPYEAPTEADWAEYAEWSESLEARLDAAEGYASGRAFPDEYPEEQERRSSGLGHNDTPEFAFGIPRRWEGDGR